MFTHFEVVFTQNMLTFVQIQGVEIYSQRVGQYDIAVGVELGSSLKSP